MPLNSRRRLNLSAICKSTYIYLPIYMHMYLSMYINISHRLLSTMCMLVLFYIVCPLTFDDVLIYPRYIYLPIFYLSVYLLISVSLYLSNYIHTFFCVGPLLYRVNPTSDSRRRYDYIYICIYVYTHTCIYIYIPIHIYLYLSI